MRKYSCVVLAFALIFSIFSHAQKAPASDADVDAPVHHYPYEVYAGVGETSQNQLVHAHGFLLGYEIGVKRDLGKYFGFMAQGASFFDSLSGANSSESGYSPNVTQILAGPELHFPIGGHFSSSLHLLIGGSHTGGGGILYGSPDVSFAFGYGMGLEYKLSPHWSVKVAGDDVHASFVQGAPGNSPNEHSNAQSTLGLAYRFSDLRFGH